jgi:glycosyltransferase involved in cell wall biosynthesis
LSVSDALGREVQKLGIDESRVVVIPNGIDAARFVPMDREAACAQLEIDATNPIVGCVSRLSREKGIDVLVRAVAMMQRADAQVKVVGHGVERANLERLARDVGVSDRVEFAGMKPHNEVPVWINAATVMALPSRIEGHPNAVLEAMACGKPVVASRVGGVPEAIYSEDLGALVPPDDPQGLARALDAALERRWDIDRIVAVGARRTWDTVADEILNVIEDVLSNGSLS